MSGSAIRSAFLSVVVTCSLAACQKEPQTPQKTVKPEATASIPADDIPLGRLPAEVKPLAYRLDLTIDPQLDEFSGKTTIDLDIIGSRDHFYLHGKAIEADKVQLSEGADTFDGSYEQVDPSGVVRITSPRPLEGKVQVVIDYRAPFNHALEGLYKVSESGNDYAFTQFEAISARLAFPGFDEPGFKTPFTTTLRVPENQVAISNTPEVSSETIDGMKVVHFAPTRPLPTSCGRSCAGGAWGTCSSSTT